MIIDTNAIMSVTEANQNFSRATRMLTIRQFNIIPSSNDIGVIENCLYSYITDSVGTGIMANVSRGMVVGA